MLDSAVILLDLLESAVRRAFLTGLELCKDPH